MQRARSPLFANPTATGVLTWSYKQLTLSISKRRSKAECRSPWLVPGLAVAHPTPSLPPLHELAAVEQLEQLVGHSIHVTVAVAAPRLVLVEIATADPTRQPPPLR